METFLACPKVSKNVSETDKTLRKRSGNERRTPWTRKKRKKRYTGFLPKDLTYVRAKDSPDKLSHIRRGDEILSLPEESDAIELLGFGWIPPNERIKWSLK